MKFKLPSQLLVSAIALSGVVVSPAMAQYPGQYPPQASPGQYPPQGFPGQYPPQGFPGQYPPVSSTSFVCGQVGGSPATLVLRNGSPLQSPLIVWQTASYDMSPQERCQMVSWQMTTAVAQNGGKLSNLLLTTGKVNGYSVICFVNVQERCNPNNVIMTLLRGENARNPGNVLARIIRFGQQGGGSNVLENGGFTGGVVGEQEIIPTAVSMEEAVNQLANESGGMLTAPAPGGYTPPNPGGYTPPNPGGYTPPNPGANSGGGPI